MPGPVVVDISGAFGVFLDTLTRTNGEFVKTAREFSNSVSTMRHELGQSKEGMFKRSRAERTLVEQLAKKQKELAGTYTDLTGKVKKAIAASEKGGKAADRANKRLEKAFGSITEESKRLNPGIKAAADEFAKASKAGNLTTSSLKNLFDTTSDAADTQIDLAKNTDQAAKSVNGLIIGFSDLGRHVYDTITPMNMLKVSAGLVVAGFARIYDELETARKRQTGVYSLATFGGPTAYQLSLVPAQMQQFVGDFKTTILAASDAAKTEGEAVQNYINTVKSSFGGATDTLQEQAYKMTGNFEEANVLLGNSMRMIQQFSIDPNMTLDEMGDIMGGPNGLLEKFRQLSSLTGKTSQEIQLELQGMLASESMKENLLKLDKKQRGEYTRSLLSFMEYGKTIGLSTDKTLSLIQEMESAKSGKSLIELWQEALQGGQAMGVMGFDAKDIARFQDLKGKGDLLTAEENKELMNLQVELAKVWTAARTGEKTGQKLIIDQMGIKFLSEDIRRGISIAADRGESLDPNKTGGAATGKLSGFENMLMAVKEIYDTIAPFFKDPTVMIGLGMAGAVAALTAIGVTAHRANTLLAQIARNTGLAIGPDVGGKGGGPKSKTRWGKMGRAGAGAGLLALGLGAGSAFAGDVAAGPDTIDAIHTSVGLLAPLLLGGPVLAAATAAIASVTSLVSNNYESSVASELAEKLMGDDAWRTFSEVIGKSVDGVYSVMEFIGGQMLNLWALFSEVGNMIMNPIDTIGKAFKDLWALFSWLGDAIASPVKSAMKMFGFGGDTAKPDPGKVDDAATMKQATAEYTQLMLGAGQVPGLQMDARNAIREKYGNQTMYKILKNDRETLEKRRAEAAAKRSPSLEERIHGIDQIDVSTAVEATAPYIGTGLSPGEQSDATQRSKSAHTTSPPAAQKMLSKKDIEYAVRDEQLRLQKELADLRGEGMQHRIDRLTGSGFTPMHAGEDILNKKNRMTFPLEPAATTPVSAPPGTEWNTESYKRNMRMYSNNAEIAEGGSPSKKKSADEKAFEEMNRNIKRIANGTDKLGGFAEKEVEMSKEHLDMKRFEQMTDFDEAETPTQANTVQ